MESPFLKKLKLRLNLNPFKESPNIANVKELVQTLQEIDEMLQGYANIRAKNGELAPYDEEIKLLELKNKILVGVFKQDAVAMQNSLKLFIQGAWNQVEPKPFIDGWHIDAICEHLEAVSDGEIQQLIINIPPRHSKSLIASVLFPAWEWTTKPEHQYLCATYAQRLTVRDALKMRRLVQSEWYAQYWGDRVRLSYDQWAKTRFENTAGGYRVSSSVGGLATGEGGTRIIIDDPHNVQDTESDVKRQSVLDWYDDSLSTRDNDPKNFARILIMQRIHERDLTGHLLEKGGFELLRLPLEYEGDRFYTSIGWSDPRTELGEILCPERFSRESVERIKLSLGKRGTSGQLQQNPYPKEGNEFNKEWWAGDRNRYRYNDSVIRNKTLARFVSWDTALKDAKDNDFTAMVVGELLDNYQLLIRFVWQDKVQSPALVKGLSECFVTWNKDNKLNGILIEDKGSGTTALQTLNATVDDAAAEMLIAINPQGNKEFRARQAAIWAEKGMILLPFQTEGVDWLFDFEKQLFGFPNAANDDMVDAFTQLVLYLTDFLEIGYKIKMGYYEVEEDE